jgi:sugar fermentation stimulation protein A
LRLPQPLKEGRIIKRYKRFFVDVETEREPADGPAHSAPAPSGPITVHLPNTGSLRDVLSPGQSCRYSMTDDPNRKLKGTLQMVKTPTSWVGVNTQLPNQLVHEALTLGRLSHWNQFSKLTYKPEFKLTAHTRLDGAFLDPQGRPQHLVEVKNVTWAKEGTVFFPDSVTERGTKHLQELTRLAKDGLSTEIFFVVQREDCETFQVAADLDPDYARAFEKALAAGVLCTVHAVTFTGDRVELSGQRPCRLLR